GGDGIFDLGEGHQGSFVWPAADGSVFHLSRRSTYLTVTSTSRLTRSPGPLRPSVVTSAVWGMTAAVKPSSSTSTTVRLTPSTAIEPLDRKSTRLNSSHVKTSYAVFCLKKRHWQTPGCLQSPRGIPGQKANPEQRGPGQAHLAHLHGPRHTCPGTLSQQETDRQQPRPEA